MGEAAARSIGSGECARSRTGTRTLRSVGDACAPLTPPDTLMPTTGMSGQYEAQGLHSLRCWNQNSWIQLYSESARALQSHVLSCLSLGWLSCW